MRKMIFTGVMLAVSAGACVSCGGADGGIEGAWVEPNPIDRTAVQGFRLHADGSAESIGMETLVFGGWSVSKGGKTLILTGESIGNGQTIPVADTLTIDRLDADSLILSDGTGSVVWRLARQK